MKLEAEKILSARKSEIFDAQVDTPHLSAEVLGAWVERGGAPSPEALAHVARCAECRGALASLSAQEVVDLGARRRLRLLGVLSLAASIAAVVLIFRTPDSLTSKGSEQKVSVELTLLATDPQQNRRDIRDGSVLSLSDRLGFKYGSSDGVPHTLTILGKQGEKIFWYYPENETGEAVRVEPGSFSVRLPFDIALAENHRPGPLTIVAVFDTNPRTAAAAFLRGELVLGKFDQRFEMKIEGQE